MEPAGLWRQNDCTEPATHPFAQQTVGRGCSTPGTGWTREGAGRHGTFSNGERSIGEGQQTVSPSNHSLWSGWGQHSFLNLSSSSVAVTHLLGHGVWPNEITIESLPQVTGA